MDLLFWNALFQFWIFISEIKSIFEIFKIVLGAGSKVLVQEAIPNIIFTCLATTKPRAWLG